MSDLEIIQFHSNGPTDCGLSLWDPISSEGVALGEPVQHCHTYFDDSTTTLTAGVWTCTPFTAKPSPYAVNELMIVLEGAITIINEQGVEETIGAGQGFVIPKGMPSTWKQTEFVRKFYVIFDDPSEQKPIAPGALGLHRLDPNVAMAPLGDLDPSRYEGSVPTQHINTIFTDATGQMTAGLWASTAMHVKPYVFMRNELMHLLEGSVTITNGDGIARTFSAGDTFLVPKGMTYQWHSDGYVKKIFCIFEPHEVLAKASGQ